MVLQLYYLRDRELTREQFMRPILKKTMRRRREDAAKKQTTKGKNRNLRLEKIYDKFFYDRKTLGNLPKHPKLVIGATNLQTARAFTFSRNWMQDATYQFMQPAITFKAKDFPVSRAVMASSCVPFAFSPIPMAKRFFTDPEDFKRVKPVLVDGGVYDNQGIHKLIQEGRYSCATVITSDAGGASGFMNSSFRNVLSLLLSTVDVFMSRIKKVQLAKDVFENAKSANRQVAYLSLAWDSENCIPGFIENLEDGRITQEVIAAHGLHAGWVENPKAHHAEITQYLKLRTGYADILLPSVEDKNTARAVGTNLTSLSQKKLDCLIAQAEALTEIQVRLYCPTLFN
ncbi:MAG: hypothetical protein EOO09_15785 [Chitinophagaceae bacterium]|nr:MAG: hypothetical protein EOO09_15785 [Chitinophagaceae bacterium]